MYVQTYIATIHQKSKEKPNMHDSEIKKMSEKYQHLVDYNPKSKFWLVRKVTEFFNMEMPPAATSKEWRAWRAYAKKTYPVRYFIAEELPPMIWWPVKHRISDIYWWIQHRLNPKHRYHVIKPRTLDPGYYDARTLILHAQMDILVDFYEHQEKYGHVDWEGTEEHSDTWKEIKAIHDWWIAHQDREKLLPAFPEHPEGSEKDLFFGIDEVHDHPDSEYSIAWRKVSEDHFRMEAEWDRQEEEMINRLAKIRLYLWD